MITETIIGLLIPFVGTALGAGLVFAGRGQLGPAAQGALRSFSGGVMTAASVWSMLLPALEESATLGPLAFLPAVVGFWGGVLFLRLLDRAVGSIRPAGTTEGTAMLALAVTLHNLPEGMAVGVVYAGYLRGEPGVTALGALSLALGIAIQNIPEGAVISMPLRADGMGKGRAFWYGAMSGAVEPVGALLTLLCAALVIPAMPWLLGFAAGAMLYVTVAELLPTDTSDTSAAALLFSVGFTLMMALDVALG